MARVRSMKKEDLEQVGQLAGRLVRMHYAFDEKRFMKPVDPERGYARWFGAQLEHPEVILLVAETDELGIVGYAYARLEPKNYNDLLEAHAKLHDILVDERARKQGVGEAILKEVIRRAKEKGAPQILLLTAAQNEAGQRLFAKMGFRTTMLEMTRALDD